jgi:RNA polymerase sigma-70 factor (ECF subfamily)
LVPTPIPRSDDAALAEALREGREEAYERLIDLYQQPVHQLVYRLLNDPGESSDVVQEVFLKVFRNIHHFRGNSSLRTWIYRIAVNEAHNRRRWFSRHRRQEIVLGCDSDEPSRSPSGVLADPAGSPFELAVSEEAERILMSALDQISPNFREAVILRDVQDLSYEDIAEVLQISLGTVKSRILRGREALRQQLTGRLQTASHGVWKPAAVSGD